MPRSPSCAAPPGEAANSVRVDYRVEGDGHSQLRHVLCRFGGAEAEPGSRRPHRRRHRTRPARRSAAPLPAAFLSRHARRAAARSGGGRNGVARHPPRFLRLGAAAARRRPALRRDLRIARLFLRSHPRPRRARGVRLRRSRRARRLCHLDRACARRGRGLALRARRGLRRSRSASARPMAWPPAASPSSRRCGPRGRPS